MQRKISNDIKLGKTISPFDSIGASSAVDRSVIFFKRNRKGTKNQKINRNW